jgi:hypothetical protein
VKARAKVKAKARVKAKVKAKASPPLTPAKRACVDNADCQIAGLDVGFECVDGRCAAPANCVDDGECVALFSGWFLADSNGDFIPDADCSANVACGAGQVCVDLFGGSGRCALTPADGACFGEAEVVTVAVLGGGNQEVCAQPGADDATCNAGSCANLCATNDDCAADLICRDDGQCVACLTDDTCTDGTLNTCINESFCGCSADADCAGNPSGENCIEALGLCGCAEDADCEGSATGDVCFDGFCGCEEVADCNADGTFDGTSYVCE